MNEPTSRWAPQPANGRPLRRLLSALVLGWTFGLQPVGAESLPPIEPYCEWQHENFTIAEPLCGLKGDPERGKALAVDSYRGNCVACHVLPYDDIEGYGTIAPPLAGIASRYPAGYIRMRVVDSKSVNPYSIMPGYYRDPSKIHRPRKDLAGRTFLTAQQVEDVIAFLLTLK